MTIAEIEVLITVIITFTVLLVLGCFRMIHVAFDLAEYVYQLVFDIIDTYTYWS